jgi:hypothetical protein
VERVVAALGAVLHLEHEAEEAVGAGDSQVRDQRWLAVAVADVLELRND